MREYARSVVDVSQTGALAGRYRMLQRVAAGGMGTVYRALDLPSGREVAVKVLDDVGSDEFVERFRREAEILAELDHPAIVRFIDFGAADGGPMYLAMEWLDGVDLARRLEDGVLGVPETLHVARLVAEALSAAHALGVVHRDVKPHNIFLVDGRLDAVKVLDFGIAFAAGRSVGITRTGMTVGTPEYMPPEQARGERGVDARVDIYSLGCVMFQCLTGRPPFFGPTPAAIVAELLLTEAPRLSARAPQVSAGLDALVAAMLSKDPAGRPSSAREVVERLLALELEDAPAVTDARRPAVSTDERRLATVVAIAPDAAATSDAGATLAVMSAGSEAHEAVAAVAAKHGGELRLLPGRGALIVFTSDSPVEAALSAARAAVGLTGADPSLRVGVAAGSASRRTGPEPALIQRALDLASEAGRVRVDDAAKGLVGGALAVEMTAVGPVVRGERRVEQTGVQAFVGRERELATIGGALDACFADRVAQLVTVTGAAGLGKSRLQRELLERARRCAGPPAILDARGEELRRQTPFASLGALLRRGLSIPEAATPNEQRAALKLRVGAWAPADAAARLVDFLGIAAGQQPEAGSVELAAALRDPQLMDDQIERATIDLLEILAGRFGGVAIVLDDAHWVDGATLKLLVRALRRMSDRPLFVAAFGRPELDERAPAALRDAAAQRVQLGGLPRRAAEHLVQTALGDLATPAAVERIVRHAEGNPLFLHELCAAELEGRSPSSVPPTVLASVEARLLRLEPSARKVLRAASVFGDAFWQGGVAALIGAGVPEAAQLGDWLVHLVDRGFLVPRRATRFAGEPELAFRHPLLREASYAMLTTDDRRDAHARAAAWLAAAGERDAAVLAEHRQSAGDHRGAAACFAHAAHDALLRNDLVRVEEHGARALHGGLEGEERGRVLIALCEASYWLGGTERGLQHGLAACELLQRDTQPWVDAVCVTARCMARTGDPRAMELARELVRSLREHASLSARPSCMPDIVASCLRVGLHTLSTELLDAVGQARARADDPLSRAHVLTCRSWQAMFAGEYAACVSYDTEVLRLMREAGDVRQACQAQMHVGYDYLLLGAYDLAVAELSAAQQAAEAYALDALENVAKHNLSVALHRLGESDRGLEMQREYLAYALSKRNVFDENHARHYLALIHLERGEVDAAEVELERTLEVMPSSALRWDSLAKLGVVALHRGDFQRARALVDEAVAGVDALKNAEEGDGFVRLAAVQIYAASGDHARSAELLVSARNRLLWRAGRIADPALRRSFMRNIPEHAVTLELSEKAARPSG